ncbi:ABC transporter permease subunit [Candidatus Poribacteria bacterium]|nr:ABC transporter permease subunit [Candidatus Poribacteria bacterium]
MYSIWIIAGRQFTENIFSLRLLIGLIVCFALFVSSTYVLTEDYEKRLSIRNAAEIEHRNALETVKVYSHLKVDVTKPPEPLSVICLGMERQLGSTVTISYEDVPTEARVIGGGNPLLNVFSAVDAVLMVQIAFSLFVIAIAYDVICGERESGTLALIASNPVSKYHILIGKYVGGMASLLVPLTIGWIAAVLLISANPMMEFHIAEWSRFALLFAALALYLSVFFLLSMLISAVTQRTAKSLVWLLFFWIVIVFIIPNGAVYIAKQVRPIPSKAVVNIESAAIRTAFNEKIRDYGAKHRSNSYFSTGYSVISGNQPFAFQVLTASREAMRWYLDGARFYIPQRIEYAAQIGDLHREYYRSLKRQTVLAENLSRLSPAWVYYNLSAGLSGTDLRSHERFIQQAQAYRRSLIAYMQEQGAFSSISWFAPGNINDMPSQAGLVASDEDAFLASLTPKSWEDVESLDLSSMPVFTNESAWGNTALGGAFLDLVYLIFLNMLLFLSTSAVFLKSEVR